MPLGVHGLPPEDPRVLEAYAAQHRRWEEAPYSDGGEPKSNTFAWAVDLYKASHKWDALAPSTRQNRTAILKRYVDKEGDWPLSLITTDMLEANLYAKGGNAAVNELKALRGVFGHLKKLRLIKKDPTAGVEIERPKTKGYPTAGPEEIQRFQERWEVGTTERLIFDLALFTGAARTDLSRLSRRNVKGELLTYARQKTGAVAEIPLTAELREVIARTPDIAPAFILTSKGQPYASGSMGNLFADAAVEVGMTARLHGLRKAFCVYWAEKGVSTHQIAAMAGHTTLSEVERYTRAADRKRIVSLLIGKA